MKRFLIAAALICFAHAPVHAATQGAVVAIGDEWVFSDAAFDGASFNNDFTPGNRAAAERLTENLADLLGGQTYLIATDNPFGYGAQFETHLESATVGKSVTRVNTQLGFETELATADAVFLVGQIGSTSFAALDSFVANGGSVVVSLGAGLGGGAAAEAGTWNPFLNEYGLTALGAYAPAPRYTPLINMTDGPLALDDGVSEILWGYGNQIALTGTDPADGLVTGAPSGFGSINAIGVSLAVTAAVPLPAGLPLMLAGFGSLALLRRRRG